MIKSFRDMDMWQKSVSLSAAAFKMITELPRSEDYGLASQVRRSTNSVSANIAEGFGRRSKKDKRRYYIIARGSVFETQNHLLYGQRVEYFESAEVTEIIAEYDDLIYQLNKIMKSLS